MSDGRSFIAGAGRRDKRLWTETKSIEGMVALPSEFAFNWRPGLLEWLIVLELMVLLTLAVYRYVAGLLGRNAPTDPFVIFYRVFWRAFRTPNRYPVPVNYQPVLPKRDKPQRDESVEGAGLSDDEIEALMAGGSLGDDVGGPKGGRIARTGAAADVGDDDEDEDGTARQSNLEAHVVAGRSIGVRSVQDGVMTVSVNVPPDDGRANRIVIEQACRLLQIKTHQVAIQAGHTKAEKTLRITGLSQRELAARLEHLGQAPGDTIGFAPGP